MLGVGVESTHLPEVVLDRGRRLELFLADIRNQGVGFRKESTSLS